MGFLANEIKKTAKAKNVRNIKRNDIPIASLNSMGCTVCPRHADEKTLYTPKMGATGSDHPLVYMLGSSPSLKDDSNGEHFSDKAGGVIYQQFDPTFWKRQVRCNYITQCMTPDDQIGGPGAVAIECCRGRIVTDIEQTKPLVIVGVGDDVLDWATGLGRNTMAFRGTFIPIKIGKHTCWFYPVLFPNFVYKKTYGLSEYELTLQHDIDNLMNWLEGDEQEAPRVHPGPYDEGIEYIFGNEAGDLQRLEDALNKLAQSDSAIDIETNGLKPVDLKDPKILTCAIGTYEHTIAFPIDHPDGWSTDKQRKRVWLLLGQFLVNSREKIAHNLAFELLWFCWFFGHAVMRQSDWADTMAMWHTLDEREGTKALEAQTVVHFGFNLKAQSRVDVSRPEWWKHYSLQEVLRYNGMDTKWSELLARKLKPLLAVDPKYQWEYDRKIKTAPTLVLLEHLGLPVDLDYATKLFNQYDKQLDEIEDKIRSTPEVKTFMRRFGSFSPTNSHDVLKLMQRICKRDEIREEDRDGNVSFSTDEEALELIPAKEVPSAPLILEHRHLTRNQTTYLDPVISRKILSPDGHMHPSYSSMRARTGRLSSEVHNWPKRKHKEVRGVVAPEEGMWFVPADYGQIEFRVAAMLSEDDNLVKYCWTGYDVHKYWAQRMIKEYPPILDRIAEDFGIDRGDDEKLLKTLRQDAKNMWVFPCIFGAIVKSRAQNLRIPLEVAESLDREFWDEFPGLKDWQEWELDHYEKKLYVETASGRRRRGPMTANEIINMPIQGTALDIVCEGMNALSLRAQCEDDLIIHPRFNGHDDLSFIIPDDSRFDPRVKIIVEEMCKPRFDYVIVPLVVEVSKGPRWNEVKEIGVYRSDVIFNTPNPYA
jgi:DNA polymerase I-like protein with 3'-5' exonuclease and polymerase domains/uracil-DNA glycosylase